MTMKREQWKEILSAVDKETDLSKGNVIEKIKEKLPQDSDEYKECDKADFNVNHLLEIEDVKRTLLHLAAESGHIRVVETLIAHGADVNAVDEFECTPLHLAAYNGHMEVVNALIENKANIYAVNNGGCTPLHLAAQNGCIEVVNALIENKANIYAVNNGGCTPLHLAAQNGCIEVVIEALIKKGAKVDAVNNGGYTPLHLAAYNGHMEVVRLLLEKEADPLLKNKYGKTPMDLDKNGYIKQFLEKKAIKNGIIAGCATAALSTTIAVALFATGTIAVELMPIMTAAAVVTTAALAIGGITYMLSPSAKMEEVEEGKNASVHTV